MGVLGQSRDKGAAATTPSAQGPLDKTGFFANVGAGFRQAVAGPHSTRVGQAIYEKRLYDDVIKSLASEGEQGEDYINVMQGQRTPVKRAFRNPYVSGPVANLLNPNHNPLADLYGGGDRAESQQIWSAIQRVRQRKPDFLKQFPDEASLHSFADKTRQEQMQAAQAVTERAGTTGTIGAFVGGAGGSVASMDPENLVGGGFGTAAGKTVARTVIKRAVEGAGVNAAAAVIGVPGQAEDANRLGQPMTTGDVAHQVGEAALIGTAFGGAHVLLPHTAQKVGQVASKVVDKATAIPQVRDALVARSIAAGTINDHSLLNDWMRTHNPDGIVDTSSPDERAAAHVILRDATAKETSPLHPEAAGANDHRLDAVAQALGVDLKAPEVPSPAPIQTATVRSRRESAPQIKQDENGRFVVDRQPNEVFGETARAEHYGQQAMMDAESSNINRTKGYLVTRIRYVTDAKGTRTEQPEYLSADGDWLPIDNHRTMGAEKLFTTDSEALAEAKRQALKRSSPARETQAILPSRRPATYEAAVHQAEGTGKNPDSSADGHFQFTKGTWLEYAPRVADTKGMSEAQILALRHDLPTATRAEQMFRADNARYLRSRGVEDSPGNLSLAHFLGKADAAKVLAADPATPIERLVDPASLRANRKVLEGKSASEVVAWAHKRIGAAVDLPVARADAVPDADALDAADYSDTPYERQMFKPDEVETDAGLMQYKSGGDENGVTGKLKDVTAWDPIMSSEVLVWEGNDGRRVVVDGHQRVGLAKRLAAEGQDIDLPALVVREADGITAPQARVLGALRNINLGTGSLLDNARVLRDAPHATEMLKGAEHRREIEGLSKLSYEAFGAAINDVIDPRIAAEIGKHAPEPSSHMAMVGLLAKEHISKPGEAATIVRQALADGMGSAREEQLGMFGESAQQSLYVPIARILDAARRKLKEEKRTFRVLSEKSGKIEAAGNVLDRTANEEKVVGSDEALAILDATAHSAGPVRDALIAAARAELSGSRRGDAVNGFLDALSDIDLHSAARGASEDGLAGEPLGEAGSRDAAAEADRILSEGDGPSLFDHAVAAKEAAEPFSDPVGEGARAQTELLNHDLLMDAKAVADPRNSDLSHIAAEDLNALFDALPADRDEWHDLRVKVMEERPDLAVEALDQMDRAPAEAVDQEQQARFKEIDAVRAAEAEELVMAVNSGAQLVVANALKTSYIKHDWQVRATSKGFQFRMNGNKDQWLSIGADDHAHLMAQIGKKSRQFDALEQEAPPSPPPSLFDLPETGFRVSDEGDAQPLHELMKEAESDELAAQALKACLKGGGE